MRKYSVNDKLSWWKTKTRYDRFSWTKIVLMKDSDNSRITGSVSDQGPSIVNKVKFCCFNFCRFFGDNTQ